MNIDFVKLAQELEELNRALHVAKEQAAQIKAEIDELGDEAPDELTEALEDVEELIASLIDSMGVAEAELIALSQNPPSGELNAWQEYNKRRKVGEIFPPYLDVTGVAFDEHGYSAPDEYGGYIYKPFIDKRTAMEETGDRIDRYAAKCFAAFHYRYILDGPDSDRDHVSDNYGLSSSRQLFTNYGWTNGVGRCRWYPMPAYAEFKGPWFMRRPVGAALDGHKTVYAGNVLRHKAKQYFESFAKNGLRRVARGVARQDLHVLDQLYEAATDKDKFIADHPHYEPPE